MQVDKAWRDDEPCCVKNLCVARGNFSRGRDFGDAIAVEQNV
jgi:hypothetical protein